MGAIDQAQFNFNPPISMAIALMVGFLVFAVSLDLAWNNLRTVLRRPRAPLVGLFAQLLLLPAVAFIIGLVMCDTPSIALGLILVACCPAGALSNYLSGVAGGSIATSVAMTAISTSLSVVVTPISFLFWAGLNPLTNAVLTSITIDPVRIAVVFLVMLIIPVTAGMSLRAIRPGIADAIRIGVRRLAGAVFAVVVTVLLLGNIGVVAGFASTTLLPVLVAFSAAVALGWSLARVSGLEASDRRAVTIEVAFQNVALAVGLAVSFFPSMAGVAITSILWGVVHLTIGSGIAALWSWIPLEERGSDRSLTKTA